MPIDEVIRTIEKTDIENLQDILQALMGRYRELYPQWRILFVSAQADAADERSKAILAFISQMDSQLS